MRKFLKKQNGFTYIEAIIAIAIFLIITVAFYTVLATARSAWFNADTSIELQQGLRLTLEKISRELHESGFDKDGVWQVTIGDGTGVNGTDILKFSMPVICHGGDSGIDNNGDVAHWGAPLTWGCSSSTCMDADNDCATVDYKYVQYAINNDNQLIRAVLNNVNTVIGEDLVAQNISDFQLTNSADRNVVTLQVTAQRKSPENRIITIPESTDVYLRN